jgi:hypothetical protein
MKDRNEMSLFRPGTWKMGEGGRWWKAENVPYADRKTTLIVYFRNAREREDGGNGTSEEQMA